MTTALTEWRQAVADRIRTDIPTVAGRRLDVHSWPQLAPIPPAMVTHPGGPDGTMIGFQDGQFCDIGEPRSTLVFVLAAKWDEAAFDELETIAVAVIRAGQQSGLFTVTRVGQPGQIIGGSSTEWIGLGIDIAGLIL